MRSVTIFIAPSDDQGQLRSIHRRSTRRRGFAMTSNSRLGALVIALALTVASSVSTVHAVGDAHKVSVVSFGLFGDQGVFICGL